METLHELLERAISELYWPLLSPSSPRAAWAFAQVAAVSSDLASLEGLLQEGWREQMIGAVACLFHPQPDDCRRLLWKYFDRGSWATPQLGICAMLLDPGDFGEVRRRLLLRCPRHTEHLQDTDPMWRHVVHGGAGLPEHCNKAMAALLESYARSAAGREWLQSHLSYEDAYWALEVDFWDQGEEIARSWSRYACPILEELGFAVPDWLRSESPTDLLGLWNVDSQPPVVRTLSRGDWNQRIYRFFQALVRAGHKQLILEGDRQHLRVLVRTVSGNQALLELPGPYFEALWLRLEFHTRDGQVFDLHRQGEEPAALKVELQTGGMTVTCLDRHQPEPSFQITERNLEDCPASVWILGIDARARLDGGVAAAVASLAGPDLHDSLQEALAQSERLPGRGIITPSFQLREKGVLELIHIITMPKPEPVELYRCLESALEYASQNYFRVALPCLGCGAAGFRAQEIAGPIMAIFARFRDSLQITLSAPREVDRAAFLQAARTQNLIR